MDQRNIDKKPSDKTKYPISSLGLGSKGKSSEDANETDHRCKNIQANGSGGIEA